MSVMFSDVKKISTPITDDIIDKLSTGDMIELSGYIYTGRDAVLPRIVDLATSGELGNIGIDLTGSVIFHTAVSPAGIGPTSSNKLEIENSIPELSKAGVKLHLGKGALKESTIQALKKYNSTYAITPPVTALFESKILFRQVIAFPEEGMEAFHLLKIEKFPAIIASVHGTSLYSR